MKIDSYYEFKTKLYEWLNTVLKNGIPTRVKALCFRIYECSNNTYKLELIGSDHYTKSNNDWASNEICDFNTCKNPFVWQELPRSSFEFIIGKVQLVLFDYLRDGKYGEQLECTKYIALGFVDGDLTLIHKARKAKKYIPWHLFYSAIVWCVLLTLYFLDMFILKTTSIFNLARLFILGVSVSLFFYKLYNKEQQRLNKIAEQYSENIGKAFEKDKRSKLILLKAIYEYNNDNFFKAITTLKKLSNKTLYRVEYQTTLLFCALICEEFDDFQNAIAAYQSILRENPVEVTALNNLAVLQNKIGNYKEAMRLAIAQINSGGENAYAYYTIASALYNLYDFENAKKYANKALEIKPDLAACISLLALIYTLEESPKAKEYMDAYISLGKDSDTISSTIEIHKEKYMAHLKHVEKMESVFEMWKLRTAKPSIHFELTDEPHKSIIGGTINEDAPKSENGDEMKLLAAIFCSELPDNNLLPHRGVLRFYIVPNDNYGVNYDMLNIQDDFRVLFDADEEKFITALSNDLNDNFPILESKYLLFKSEKDAMTFSDFRFENTYSERFLKLENIELDENEEKEFFEMTDKVCHKLLGYPCFAQEDPRGIEYQYSKYDTLLFQLASQSTETDEIISIGDSGILQFFIPLEKLKKADFSDVVYTWDCY